LIQLLRQLAAPLRKLGHAGEQAPVPADQRKSGQQNREQRCDEKNIDPPLHAIVNLNDALRRLFFVFAVPHQQPRNRGAQRRLPRLQRELDLLAGLFVLAFAGRGKRAVDRVPGLCQRTGQKRDLLGRSARRRQASLDAHGIIQIGADALKTAPTMPSADTVRRCRSCPAWRPSAG
jgi:hypothetical protein